jgi:hypothetical protein
MNLTGEYWLTFRIRRIYFDQIVAGTKTVEVRARKAFWIVRAQRAMACLFLGIPVGCIFLCGKDVHRRGLVLVEAYDTAEEALGRPPSPQGLKDIGTGPCYGFHLGAVA